MLLKIFTKEVKKTPLNIDEPAPLPMNKVDWVIITKDNYEEVFEKLKKGTIVARDGNKIISAPFDETFLIKPDVEIEPIPKKTTKIEIIKVKKNDTFSLILNNQ